MHRARFWHEWASGTWLWAADEATADEWGYSIDHHELDLPQDLVEELDRLAEWHDRALNWAEPQCPGPWRKDECDRFNTAVAAAFRRLSRAVAPDWRIVDDFVPEVEHPELDEYLADPDRYSPS